MENSAKLIVGTWRLVHSVSINTDSEKEYRYGEDAIGYLHYTDTGIMAAQISRKSREKSQDISRLEHDYLAYFGKYEIDTEKQVVRHFVEGQLFPGQLPDIVERTYLFDGDFMSLKPVDGSNREILWQKVR